jgi:hypothetical protein
LRILKGETKLLLFLDAMIGYGRNPKESIEHLLDLIKSSSRFFI